MLRMIDKLSFIHSFISISDKTTWFLYDSKWQTPRWRVEIIVLVSFQEVSFQALLLACLLLLWEMRHGWGFEVSDVMMVIFILLLAKLVVWDVFMVKCCGHHLLRASSQLPELSCRLRYKELIDPAPYLHLLFNLIIARAVVPPSELVEVGRSWVDLLHSSLLWTTTFSNVRCRHWYHRRHRIVVQVVLRCANRHQWRLLVLRSLDVIRLSCRLLW